MHHSQYINWHIHTQHIWYETWCKQHQANIQASRNFTYGKKKTPMRHQFGFIETPTSGQILKTNSAKISAKSSWSNLVIIEESASEYWQFAKNINTNDLIDGSIWNVWKRFNSASSRYNFRSKMIKSDWNSGHWVIFFDSPQTKNKQQAPDICYKISSSHRMLFEQQNKWGDQMSNVSDDNFQ